MTRFARTKRKRYAEDGSATPWSALSVGNRGADPLVKQRSRMDGETSTSNSEGRFCEVANSGISEREGRIKIVGKFIFDNLISNGEDITKVNEGKKRKKRKTKQALSDVSSQCSLEQSEARSLHIRGGNSTLDYDSNEEGLKVIF